MATKKKRKSVKVADLVRTAAEAAAPDTEKRPEPSAPPHNPYAFVSRSPLEQWRYRALDLAHSIWLRIDASLKTRFPLMREMLYQRVKPLRRFADAGV